MAWRRGIASSKDVQGGPSLQTGSQHRVLQARGAGWLWDGGAVTVPGCAVPQDEKSPEAEV